MFLANNISSTVVQKLLVVGLQSLHVLQSSFLGFSDFVTGKMPELIILRLKTCYKQLCSFCK